MKFLLSLTVFAVCAMFVAVMPAAAAETAAARDAAPLKVYDVGTIAPARYTVLKRLWVESWRTAFDVPTQNDSGAAIRQLLDEAVGLGADGVVNLYCLNKSGVSSETGRYFCYGDAIKVK